MTEAEIVKQLSQKFVFLEQTALVKRPRRISVAVQLENFDQVFAYLVKELGFNSISAITGLDETTNLAVIYHLVKDGQIVLNLLVRPAQTIKTVTDYFPAADIYERELEDLFGIKVKGLVPGHNYPLPENWPQGEHPLLKSWQQEGVKHEI